MGLVAITPKFLADDGNAIFFSFDSAGTTYTGVLVPFSVYKVDTTESGGKITGNITTVIDRSRWVESLKYAARNSTTVQIEFNTIGRDYEDVYTRIWHDVHDIFTVLG